MPGNNKQQNLCGEILVVDDDEGIRKTLKMFLELEGYSVCVAANGQEALAQLAVAPRPCLVLLDLMMPVMNGWEFMEVLGKDKRYEGLPVLVVTANLQAQPPKHALGVLRKPIQLDELMDQVCRCCTRK